MFQTEMITTILSFNHPNLTSRCVQSALRFVSPKQILLVHNGSRPENVTTLKNEFSEIHHACLETNRGFSGGANFALQTAFSLIKAQDALALDTPMQDAAAQHQPHKWVYFVTNDCELLNTPTQPQQMGLFAPLIYRRQTQKIDSIGGTFRPLTGRLEHFRSIENAHQFLKQKSKRIKIDLQKYFYVPGTAFFIDQHTLEKLGGFDETLHTYWEDVDLSARAAKLNLHLGIATDTHLMHKVGKTCHKDPFYTNHLFKRNRKTVSSRHVAKWLKPLQTIYIK